MNVVKRLWLCLAASTGLLLLAGASTTALVDHRVGAVETIGAGTGRVEAAWDIHRELAFAASAGADSFLSLAGSPGDGVEANRKFDEAMRNAASATTRAADPADAPDGEARTESCPDLLPAAAAADGAVPPGDPAPDPTAELTTLACLSPGYARLVGEARAHSRSGGSVGAAYLRRAATLMHGDLLPASARLAHARSDQVAAGYQQATRTADFWIVLGTGLATIAVLLGVQVLLVRWTKRWLCPPLLAATLLVVASLTWTLVALDRERDHLESAYTQGYELRSQLAHTRQLALRAEGDVLYWSITRGGSVAFDDDYRRVAERLEVDAAFLDPGIAELAATAVRTGDDALLRTTTGVCNAAADGTPNESCDTPAAGASQTGPAGQQGPATADSDTPAMAAAFDELHMKINDADAKAKASFAVAFDQAGGWLNGLPLATAALFGVAAFLAAVGIAPRLWEYR